MSLRGLEDSIELRLDVIFDELCIAHGLPLCWAEYERLPASSLPTAELERVWCKTLELLIERLHPVGDEEYRQFVQRAADAAFLVNSTVIATLLNHSDLPMTISSAVLQLIISLGKTVSSRTIGDHGAVIVATLGYKASQELHSGTQKVMFAALRNFVRRAPDMFLELNNLDAFKKLWTFAAEAIESGPSSGGWNVAVALCDKALRSPLTDQSVWDSSRVFVDGIQMVLTKAVNTYSENPSVLILKSLLRRIGKANMPDMCSPSAAATPSAGSFISAGELTEFVVEQERRHKIALEALHRRLQDEEQRRIALEDALVYESQKGARLERQLLDSITDEEQRNQLKVAIRRLAETVELS